MPPLKIEVFDQQTESWRQAGVINPGDPYGSVSDNTDTGRDIYYFGVDSVEGKAFIKKSLSGVDVVDARLRTISTLAGTSLVASLDPGEQHELTIKTDIGLKPRRVRFTHLSE